MKKIILNTTHAAMFLGTLIVAVVFLFFVTHTAFAQTGTNTTSVDGQRIEVQKIEPAGSVRPSGEVQAKPLPTTSDDLRRKEEERRKFEILKREEADNDDARTTSADTKSRIDQLRNTVTTQGDGARSFLDKARDTFIQKRDQAEEKIDQLRDRGEEQVDRARDRVSDVLEEKATRYLKNVSAKMSAAIERLEKLAERIESRITKFKENGVDTTEAERLLEEARASIKEAQASLDQALTDAREVLLNDLSRESFGKVVATLTKAKEHLRDAHQSLVKVIRILKGAVGQSDNSDTDDGDENTDTTTE